MQGPGGTGDTFLLSPKKAALTNSLFPPRAGLLLWGNSLTGTADLNLPSSLRQLHLSKNQLISLPANLPDSLEDFSFHGNRLSGTLSATSLRLPINLVTIRLDLNFLAGPLPAWASFPSGLKRLGLSSNSFTGSIPPEWSSMPDGISIEMMHNELTGVQCFYSCTHFTVTVRNVSRRERDVNT